MPRDIVAFAEDWGGLPSSTQHIVGRLARDRDVLWINSIGMRRPRFNRRDASRLITKISHLAPSREPHPAPSVDKPARLTVVSPLAVSWPGSRLAAFFNRAVLGGQVRRKIDGLHMKKPIMWTSLPTAVPMVGAFGESPVVYYVGDDFAALPGVDHEPVSAMERRLVDRADLILAASEKLASKFPANRTVFVPHGVDFARFSTPAPRAADLPVSGRIAGFYGSIAEWVDVDLIARCAAAMPDWTFVLIGEPQARVDVGALRAAPNVLLLGPRPNQALPSYVQHWDVSLLPMRDTPMIRAGNPLKLREYLASGTPIAATDFGFPSLAPYADLIRTTADPTGFCETIRLAADDKADFQKRRTRVADEGWDTRVRDVSALLEAL
jgi:glycosyltransferase involved in cell wall biosynthesis